MKNKYALAIHGGAGTILKAHLTQDQELAYKSALREALEIGQEIVLSGGTALKAVEETVKSLEDAPLFNAGRGAVFTNEGKHEMEASIMCGKTLNAGAVAGIRNIKNPVELASRIITDSDFVYLSGDGATQFAKDQKLKFESDEYFFSQFRYEQMLAAQHTSKVVLDHDGERKFGTVGAVALDLQGNIAAATSTGGLTNKKYGRLGDSSVIGSGTYANNNTCAISCTGYGEFFLRAVVAYDISCLMEYKGMTLHQACTEVIQHKLVKMRGEGGVIAVDKNGNIDLNFNSAGMYRGAVSSDTELFTAIYES